MHTLDVITLQNLSPPLQIISLSIYSIFNNGKELFQCPYLRHLDLITSSTSGIPPWIESLAMKYDDNDLDLSDFSRLARLTLVSTKMENIIYPNSLRHLAIDDLSEWNDENFKIKVPNGIRTLNITTENIPYLTKWFLEMPSSITNLSIEIYPTTRFSIDPVEQTLQYLPSSVEVLSLPYSDTPLFDLKTIPKTVKKVFLHEKYYNSLGVDEPRFDYLPQHKLAYFR